MQATTTSSADELLARLAEPKTADALNRLLDQLPLLAFGAEAMSGLIARGDDITKNISDQVSEMRHVQGMEGVRDLGAALPGLMKAGTQLGEIAERPSFNNLLSPELIDELGNAERLAMLKKLLDKLELVVFAMEAVEGFLRRGDSMVEGMREGVRDAAKMMPSREMLTQLQSLWQAAPQMLQAASALAESDLLKKAGHLVEVGDRLIDSGILDPRTIEMVSKMGATLTETMDVAKTGQAREKVGLFSLLRSLKDPDIQASVSFFMNFSRLYGKKLRDSGYA